MKCAPPFPASLLPETCARNSVGRLSLQQVTAPQRRRLPLFSWNSSMLNNLLRSLLLCMSLTLATGCGIIDMIYLPPAEDTAQEIFEAGNDAMAEKNYVRAVELYNKLRDAYPFSPYTTDAELSLADAYYLDGEYVLAAESYKDFESLHPRHKAIEYVKAQFADGKEYADYLKAIRYIDAQKEIFAGKDVKTIFMPFGTEKALGSIGSLSEIAKESR